MNTQLEFAIRPDAGNMLWTSSEAYNCWKKAECLWGEANKLINERMAYGELHGTDEAYYMQQAVIESVMRHAKEMEDRAKRMERSEEEALERDWRAFAEDRRELANEGRGG